MPHSNNLLLPFLNVISDPCPRFPKTQIAEWLVIVAFSNFSCGLSLLKRIKMRLRVKDRFKFIGRTADGAVRLHSVDFECASIPNWSFRYIKIQLRSEA